MTILTKKMWKYIEGETRQSYSKEVQRVYDSRIKDYIEESINDLGKLARIIPSSWRQEVFDQEKLGSLLQAVLKPVNVRFNEYVKDIWSHRTALVLLGALNAALNENLTISNTVKLEVSDGKLRRFRNIGFLESMINLYPLERKE